MLSSHALLHRRLDELALDALGPPVPLPGSSAWDSDVSIEVIWEDEAAIDELAATGQFVRFSAPYERIELEEMPPLAPVSVATLARRPTSFARTISAAQTRVTAQIVCPVVAEPTATVPFERVWFEDDDHHLATIEDRPVEPKASWWWLAISLAAGAAAVIALALA